MDESARWVFYTPGQVQGFKRLKGFKGSIGSRVQEFTGSMFRPSSPGGHESGSKLFLDLEPIHLLNN